jgi:inhibitor of KinA sporulation pathway (predicted exonuclease)
MIKKMDIMIDLEVLGIGDNPVIMQLSAILFSLDENNQQLDSFDKYINIQNSIEKGFITDESTKKWWDEQNNDVYSLAANSKNNIEDVLRDFSDWIDAIKKKYKSKINVWGNGILADNKWVSQAYKICNIQIPWIYYEDRDVRTLTELGDRICGYDYRKINFEGIRHNALDDCRHQIKYCCEIYKLIKNLT